MGLQDDLNRDNVGHLPLREPVFVTPETSVRRTVEVMQSERMGCILVCRDGELVGIFTERDLMRRVLARRADPESPVEQYMTPRPAVIARSDPIAHAVRVMSEGHYRHLPVVDDRGRPVGIASAKHIVAYLVDYYPSAVYNLPPQPGQVQEAREGA
ncbi:MAG: CBS domain-containing protein [Phycisphaerae bacterium]